MSLEERIRKLEEKLKPKPKVVVRFTTNKDEVDETMEAVLWVYFDLEN